LVAIDLPGFGASERRDELLSPRGMGDFLLRLIDEAGLGAPHVVAPDVGTSAALFVGDEVTATAMIDRLVHHAEILSLKGDSYRLRDKDLGAPPPRD
jgi:hypothetical protein